MKTPTKLLASIKRYVKYHYVSEDGDDSKPRKSLKKESIKSLILESPSYDCMPKISKIEFMISRTWQAAVFDYIDFKGYKDSDVYKRAIISKQTFSKIRSNSNYQPDKDTAIKMCIGLELSLDETDDLLRLAGHALSPSIKRDLVVQYFIKHKIYNIMSINDALHDMDLKLIPIPVMT